VQQQVKQNQQDSHGQACGSGSVNAISRRLESEPEMEIHHTLGNHGLLRRYGLPIQTKLKVSDPNDEYEQEADRVADQVMRMPDIPIQPKSVNITPLVQRQEKEEEEEEPIQTVQRETDKEEEKTPLPPKGQSSKIPCITQQLESNIDSLKGGGDPLDAQTRAFFEPLFGRDFSRLRINTDAKAAESARSVNALAYTIGRDVVFGEGQYTPHNNTGRKLIAHELTHVVQQGYHEAPSCKIHCKVSNEIGKIRSNLSYGPLDWAIRDYEVHEVLSILKKMNDIDLADTLSELGAKLTDRIFIKSSEKDAIAEASTLNRIRRDRKSVV
jgi:hypothetical protein